MNEPRVYHPRDIFVPVEKRNEDDSTGFRTSDKQRYRRGVDGVIRRADPKPPNKRQRRKGAAR